MKVYVLYVETLYDGCESPIGVYSSLTFVELAKKRYLELINTELFEGDEFKVLEIEINYFPK